MSYILISVSIYIVSVIVHVLIHRILRQRGIRTFKTVLVFLIGFIVNTAILFYLAGAPGCGLKLPLTAGVLFALLSSLYVIFYTSPYLGDESPATKVIAILGVKKKMNSLQIMGEFSDSQLIIKRLNDLKRDGLVEMKNNRYCCTDKGMKLVDLIDMYRKLLRWDRGG